MDGNKLHPQILAFKVVVAILVRPGPEVWIQQREGSGHLDGFWEFPGGKIRLGEKPLKALLREVREETGLVLERHLCNLICVENFRYPDRFLRLYFYFCLVSGSPSSEKIKGQWALVSELDRFLFPPANQKILSSLRTLVRKYGNFCMG
ncbi:MAG: NUDIX domain-containing protein [Acidobacteria bacterium]|nr:NUDIX domain-containing protein [Acidobacteriota bacterium]